MIREPCSDTPAPKVNDANARHDNLHILVGHGMKMSETFELCRYLDGELLKELPDCPQNDSFTITGYDEDLCDVDPSKLLLEYVGRSFQGNYSCEGMNAAGWGPRSEEEDLIIYCNFLFD